MADLPPDPACPNCAKPMALVLTYWRGHDEVLFTFRCRQCGTSITEIVIEGAASFREKGTD
jgi:hypothetical protein